jgi:hypothetical protein
MTLVATEVVFAVVVIVVVSVLGGNFSTQKRETCGILERLAKPL